MVGISSKSATKSEVWHESLIGLGFDLVEIDISHSLIPYDFEEIHKMRDQFNSAGMNVSLHTSARAVLHPNKTISNAHEKTSRSELILSKEFGSKDYIFHLPKYLRLPQQLDEINGFMSGLVRYAKKLGIQVYLENDSNGPFSVSENLLSVLKGTSGLKFNLDLGHLNCALHDGMIVDPTSFVESVIPWLGYLHAHGNKGVMDDHIALEDGNLDFEPLIDLVKGAKPKIVAETWTIKDALKTKKLLEKYLF